MRTEALEIMEDGRIIAIVRGVDPDKCLEAARAMYKGGIRLMEVTFNLSDPASCSNTTDAITAISKEFQGRMAVGAGTVVSVDLAERAAAAGASFIVSPNTDAEVIRRTRQLDMMSVPGALSPTEIMQAVAAGADYVKLFPAANLGTSYIKAIRAPLSQVRLVATGGVNENNFASFLDAGMYGAGIGGNLANKAWMENGEWDKITAVAQALTEIVRTHKGGQA